jgi:outer membrane lipoprotein-sorting protein
MSEENEKLEQDLAAHFAQERERAAAPNDLWPQIERRLDAGKPRSLVRRRWPALVATVGAAAAIAAGLFVLSGYLGGDGSPTADEVLAAAKEASAHPDKVGLRSYEGVAEITSPVDDDSEATIEAVPEGETSEQANTAPELAMRRSEMQVAFEAPTKYRVDLETLDPSIESGEQSLFVGDGTSSWFYESHSNTYFQKAAENPVGLVTLQYYLTPAMFFGGGIGGLIEGIRSATDAKAVIAAEDTLLGRAVYVVEISPAYSGSRSGPDGQEEYSGGVVRMWLDKEFLFALRTQIPDGEGGEIVEIRFTDISFNREIDDSLFRFTPPAGATEVESGGDAGFSSSGGSVGGEIGFPAPFLSLSQLPGGYAGRSSGTSSDANGTYFSARFLLVEEGDDGYVRGEQRIRADGMPATLQTGEPTSVNGHEAWLTESPDAINLAWQDGDIVIVLTSNRLSSEALLRIAQSMQVRAGGNDPGPVEVEPSEGGEVEVVPAEPESP